MTEIYKTLLSGGFAVALLKFVEFLIGHIAHKKERAEDKEENNLEDRMKQHLTDVNAQWKIDYCDVNTKAIENLTQEVREGLAERENTGAERYLEHKEAIEELRQTMISLAKNTDEVAKLGKYMGQSLMALTHDKLIYLGKQYQRRGAITLAEQNNLKLLYEPYHNGLGGNSDGEGYYTYCMNLPIVTDEEAAAMDKKIKDNKGGQNASV